ncbi:MAG: toll/interleukin-1 receptor domain-containing protein, partial [Planctomycetota bacterium]
MPDDPEERDFFVSYARADNSAGWITRFVDELLVEHRKFSGGRELTYFFDKNDIRSFDDWQYRLHHGLAKSRLFLAFISPSYFASEWCRKEWKAWIDTEIAKHILSGGAAAIYFVEVPGFVAKIDGLREQSMLDEHEVARQVADLCRLPEPRDDFITASALVVRQMRDRRQITSDFVQPFQQLGVDALRREDLRKVLSNLARDLDERSERVRLAADSVS